MIPSMEPLHISEGDLARDVRSILKRVETGGEVIIERDAQPVAVIRAAEPVRRKISECIALMPADSTATIDPDFAKDVEAAIAAHREPLEPAPARRTISERIALAEAHEKETGQPRCSTRTSPPTWKRSSTTAGRGIRPGTLITQRPSGVNSPKVSPRYR